MEFTFRQECSACKYHEDGLCIHPHALYCEHCELWTPNWYRRDTIEDCLTVTYDCSLPDCPTLCIGRIDGSNVRVLNMLHGKEAFDTYALLTGKVEQKNIKH